MVDERTSSPHPRVALVGYGYWGKNLARNFHSLGAMVTICESLEEHRERARESFPEIPVEEDFEVTLARSDVDAVVIATPAEFHFEMALRALNAGKDVFVEKPLALRLSDGKELLRVAREKERILMVGHLMEYHPAVIRLAELVEEGVLGSIRYIYSNRLNWGKVRREENILWSFAPHDIAIILKLVGEMPHEVTARGAGYVQPHVADVTVTHLAFPSGVRAHIFVSWLHPYKEQRLVVIGEKQVAAFEGTASGEQLRLYPHSIDWENQVPVARKAEAELVPIDDTEPLRLECFSFLEAVRTRVSPTTDGENGVRVLEVLTRCQQSLVSSGGEEERMVGLADGA